MADTKQATHWARIDDQSDLIAYSDEGWFTTKLEGASNNTLTATDAKGASAKVQFRGNRAAVIGAVSFDNSTGAPVSQYVLDGGSPVLHKPRVDQNNSLEVAFFLSPILSDGVHTLVITLITDGTPFFLDSVLYNASTADMTVTNSAGATQRPTLVTTVIATPSSLAQGPAGTEARNTVSVGPIVGGVVGGVALLVGALLAWYFLYWRRRLQGYRSAAKDDYDVLGSELKPAPQGGSYNLSAAPSIVPYNAFASPSTSPRPNQQQQTLQQQQQSYPPQANRADSAYSAPSVYSATTSAPSHYSLDPNAPPVPPIPAPYADPYASSQSGSSVSGATGRSGGRLAVVNDTAGETPALSAAQRKAREAGIRDSAAPYAQAVDSGERFDTQAGPSNAHVAPGELPPVYSES